METMLHLALLVKYVAFVALSTSVGTVLTITAYDLVRNKVREGGVFGSASVQKPVKGSAS